MRNTKSAFTLVELIVVITILAILGTIAFISLQGYSADARNSKRTSDIGNIQSAMSLKMVEGVPVMSFVDATATVNEIASQSVAWATVTPGATYHAGVPAYSVLNVAAKDFKDPNDKAYRIGATTLKAGAFQVSATMEVDGVPTAQVNGTYVKRDNTAKTVTKDGLVFTLADAAANFFKVGDTIVGATWTWTVAKVSRDGLAVTLSSTSTASGATLALAATESDGLIGSSKGTAAPLTPVTNLSTTALAY